MIGLLAGPVQAQQPVPSEKLPEGIEWAPDSERIVRPAESEEFQGARRPAPFDLNAFESVQRLGAADWPRDDINFRPTGPARPAGDVNNDGVQDWIYRYSGVPDDRMTEPERTAKTFLRFGGGTFSAQYFDQLLYRNLQAAGNLVGGAHADAVEIGDGTVTVFEGTDTGYSELGTRSFAIAGERVGTADLDGDGFEDLVFGQSSAEPVTVLFGGEALSDLELRTYAPAFDKAPRFSYAVGDADEDGTASVLRIHGENTDFGADDSLAVDLFGVDGARNLVFERGFATALNGRGSFLEPQLANIDGAALQEIFVKGAPTGTGTFVFGVGSDSTGYDNTPIEYPGPSRLIGDLNGDNQADFFLEDGNGNPFVGLGPSAVEDGPGFDVSIPQATGETVTLRTAAPLGDLTGDGTGNVILGVQGPNQFGNRRLGVSGGTAETADLLFDNAAYRTSAVVAGANVGDWNGDGSDDAALIRDAAEGKVNVYFGDPTQSASPDLTLTHPDSARARTVAAGDFTGNGQPNLAVVWGDVRIPLDSGPNVSVYEAGSGTAPIHTLNTSDIGAIGEGPLRDKVTTVANVGDVNGDGIEDFLIGAPGTQVDGAPVQEAFLFLGGASLPASPSVTVDYSGQNTSPQSLASGIQGLGDINQDGIEDFAVANPNAPVSGVDGFASGKVFVHYGQEGSAEDLNFDQPDAVLTPNPGPTEQFSFFGLGMASGDFNGDGIPDLATKPFLFRDFQTGEGIGAVHVYFGPNVNGSATADAVFPIPTGPVLGSGENLTSSVGELAAVPGFGDGPGGALLFGTSFGTTNALMFEASGGGSFEATTVLEAFDTGAGLGTNNNLIANNNRTSAIGAFNGTDRLEPVLPQEFTPFFRGTPGFTYDLPADGGPQAPTARDDEFATPEGQPLSVDAPGVLENDSDPDGDSLSASLVSGVSDGSLTLDADGAVEYTPNSGFVGQDAFTYEASDGTAADTATVTIEVESASPITLDGQLNESEYIPLGTNVDSADGFSPTNDIDSLVYYPDEANEMLHVAVAGTLETDNFNGYALWLNVVGDDAPSGAPAGTALGFGSETVDYHYLTGIGGDNTSFTADFEVDYALGASPIETSSETRAVAASYTGGTRTVAAIDTSDESGTPGMGPGPNGEIVAFAHENSETPLTGAEFKIPFSELGMSAGDDVQVFAVIVSATGYFSNETIPGNATLIADGETDGAGNPGNNAQWDAYAGGPYHTLVGNGAPTAAADSFSTPTGQTLTVGAPGVLGNDSDPNGDSLSVSLVSDVSDGSLTLDADGSFEYTPNSGFIGQDAFTYEASDGTAADTASVVIQVADESLTRPIPVAEGWNLLSVPLEAEDPSFGAVLPLCESGFFFEPGSGYSGIAEGDPVPVGRGLFANCAAGTAQVTGQAPGPTIEVAQGWNIIGALADSVDVGAITSDPPGIVQTSFFGFDGSGGYQNASTLAPGGGYWVKAGESGTLDLSGSGGAAALASKALASTPAASGAQNRSGAQLQITDAAGRTATLRLAQDVSEQRLQRAALPPVPPGETFDVRFEGGRSVAEAGGDALRPIQTQGLKAPVTIKLTGAEGGQSIRLRHSGETTRLTAERSSATLSSTKGLAVGLQAAPEAFALKKTYPNPTSGRATIQYAVPKQADVTIAVYDVLGRRVATLADGREEAGRHTARLGARQLPSGTYFVRMRAEGFQQTRRLTVVQ